MPDEPTTPATPTPATPEPLKCGLVMPISAIDGCSDQHWLDVKAILTEAIENAGFQAELVSYTDESGIIQKTIIQNLYQNPIVVCDVSGKNPNVMFELGIRLAFDKPTIVVKDDKTAYSFDTSPIEHLPYPRDLRYGQIVKFKESLAKKVKATYEKATKDPAYTTFLKNFGEFTIEKLETKEVSRDDFIIEQLADLREAIATRPTDLGDAKEADVWSGKTFSSSNGIRLTGTLSVEPSQIAVGNTIHGVAGTRWQRY